MEKEAIKKEILDKVIVKEGKQFVDCPTALAIADKLNITPIEVGRFCNELGIKIQNCQLGCF
jgi:hypothetical protein